MRRVLVIRGGAIGDLILTLPAIAALRLEFPNAHIDVMGDAEQWEMYRLFGREPRAPQQPTVYLSGVDLILSYLPAPDASFTDSLERYCYGEVIAWSPRPRGGRHVTDYLRQPVLRFVGQLPPAEPRV